MDDSTSLDWDFLSRIRDGFLTATQGVPDYWEGRESLESYDRTFGERIGWKWDAVLEELQRIGWRAIPTTLIDFGCGTGVASRRVLNLWPGHFRKIILHDRSAAARNFAAEQVRREHPEITIETSGGRDTLPDTSDALLLISHVWNELGERDRRPLLHLAESAEAVIWVEPGTKEVGREMSRNRDILAQSKTVVAPCPHQDRCGMLLSGNEDNWCHHFAFPPTEAFVTTEWRAFSEILGIDLRRLPYWYAVLDRQTPLLPEKLSRILGLPITRKHSVAWSDCSVDGIHFRELLKRDDKQLVKAIRKGKAGPWLEENQDKDSLTPWPPIDNEAETEESEA